MFTSEHIYTLHFPRFWTLRDEPARAPYARNEKTNSHESLLFHISQGDYILTLAAVLEFFKDSIKSEEIDEKVRQVKLDLIGGVIDDLIYLDDHYKIVSKDGAEK